MPNSPPKAGAGQAFLKAHPEAVARHARIMAVARPGLLELGRSIAAGRTGLLELSRALAIIFTERSEAKSSKQLANLAKQMARAARRYEAEWQATYGEHYPATIEDIQRLAVRAGLDANRVYDGVYRLGDVLPIIEGYLHRLADQKAAAGEVRLEDGALTMASDTEDYLRRLAAHMREKHEDETPPRGVTLRLVATILQDGDEGNANAMLRRWNRHRLPKPKALGVLSRDRRAKRYAPTAIVDWVEKVEGYLRLPKADLVRRLHTLAE